MYILAISYKVNSTTYHTHTFKFVDGKKQHCFIKETVENGLIKKAKVVYNVDDFNLVDVRVYMRACKRQHGATAWLYKDAHKSNKF